MDRHECMLCGRDYYSHHDFAERANGCVCDEWEGADEYLPTCKAFDANKIGDGRCGRCEHEKACHKEAA